MSRRITANGLGFLLQGYNVLKLHCGDGCTTLWIHTKNHWLVRLKWMNDMLYELYLNATALKIYILVHIGEEAQQVQTSTSLSFPLSPLYPFPHPHALQVPWPRQSHLYSVWTRLVIISFFPKNLGFTSRLLLLRFLYSCRCPLYRTPVISMLTLFSVCSNIRVIIIHHTNWDTFLNERGHY